MSNYHEEMIPVFAGNVVVDATLLKVYFIDHVTEIVLPFELASELVSLCVGKMKGSEVLGALEKDWDRETLESLFENLVQRNILIDIRDFGSQILQYLRNPSHVSIDVTDEQVTQFVNQAHARQRQIEHGNYSIDTSKGVLKLLNERSSNRCFNSDSITISELNRLIWAAYGEKTSGGRTVPSAGALYPLQVHVILNRKCGDMVSGIYRVLYGQNRTLSYELIASNHMPAVRAFLDQSMALDAHGIIILSGNQRYQSVKYGPRALLYTAVEVGHSSQNIHLVSQEMGLGTIEIGGFCEKLLIKALSSEENYQPLSSVLFGRKSDAGDEDPIFLNWVTPKQSDYLPDFSVAMAQLSSDINSDWSYGRDPDPSLAAIKARSEAREWAACSFVHDSTILSPASSLSQVIDPRSILQFHPSQYALKNFPFRKFDQDKTLWWALAVNESSGKEVRVLADLVYFPFKSEMEPYAYANSSGVAAHPNKLAAMQTSTLELLERDSFMIAYLGRLALPKVVQSSLPSAIKERISDLKELGCKVFVVDLTIDFAPVIMVYLVQEEWNFMNCAAACRFNPEEALSHALMEVEASVLARLENGPAKLISPQQVEMPLDHGALYEQSKYYRNADFMILGDTKVRLKDVGKGVSRNWESLLSMISASGFSLYSIDYTLPEIYGGNRGLNIVRSVVPGLVPMTFGYRQEAGNMCRLYDCVKRISGRVLKYQNLVKFPHPFA